MSHFQFGGVPTRFHPVMRNLKAKDSVTLVFDREPGSCPKASQLMAWLEEPTCWLPVHLGSASKRGL
jgi:hypothetical protein